MLYLTEQFSLIIEGPFSKKYIFEGPFLKFKMFGFL